MLRMMAFMLSPWCHGAVIFLNIKPNIHKILLLLCFIRALFCHLIISRILSRKISVNLVLLIAFKPVTLLSQPSYGIKSCAVKTPNIWLKSSTSFLNLWAKTTLHRRRRWTRLFDFVGHWVYLFISNISKRLNPFQIKKMQSTYCKKNNTVS